MKKTFKNLIANSIIAYASIIFTYMIFFFLLIYFKNTLKNIHDAYVITMNLIVMLNLNIMSIIFIKRFNKISRKIDNLTDLLTYEDEKE